MKHENLELQLHFDIPSLVYDQICESITHDYLNIAGESYHPLDVMHVKRALKLLDSVNFDENVFRSGLRVLSRFRMTKFTFLDKELMLIGIMRDNAYTNVHLTWVNYDSGHMMYSVSNIEIFGSIFNNQHERFSTVMTYIDSLLDTNILLHR